ncbi:Oidioi.mRNA.OKI2018_I69.PAR.g12472.t2.cds [Oikopleura dioica]|nr:Oidioi.mRNA.OKI2018_I69.PAR.g12472.t2.cds [Oikopleura dioica]
MVLMTVSAVPQINGGQDVPGTINSVLALIALFVIAVGTGGIKPCVSALGGDQFAENETGKKQLSNFFALFYGSINAGSLLSTFISPILREVECLGRPDCYAIAFLIPAILMLVAIGAFLFGKSKYKEKPVSGNIFTEFCGATWSGLRGRCKADTKDKEHFLDYADTEKFSLKRLTEFKYVYPIIVMYLPMPFFWALFDMQGSRFVLTATQMNGVFGGVTIKPDQMQIMNPVLILLFLPLFQSLIYPCFDKIGFKMTALRKMSGGQLITALAFVVAGFVQLSIDSELTPIPSYGDQTAMFVINGLPDKELTVESNYWVGANIKVDDESAQTQVKKMNLKSINQKVFTQITDQQDYNASNTYFRTPSNDWIQPDYPENDQERELKISSPGLQGTTVPIDIHEHGTKGVFCYEEKGNLECEQYDSPVEKSGSNRVRTALVNPTEFYTLFEVFNGDNESILTNKTVVISPRKASTSDSTEFERGVVKIKASMWDKEPEKDADGNWILPDATRECETKWITSSNPNGEDQYNKDDFLFGPGSIWTFSVVTDKNDKNGCQIRISRDSKQNTMNIFWLIPQYIVITVAEVMNSVTGLEFAYTQSPKSMKSVLQSFWLLTTCFGNILDVFFVEISMHPTQSGEYFILAAIMVGAALVFVGLSVFYYEYVPEGTFDEDENEQDGKNNEAFDKDEAVEMDDVKLEKEKEAFEDDNETADF